MKFLVGLRVLMTLFVAVLMPLEMGHCALMPIPASAVAIESDHHDDGDHDCCPETASAHEPTPPTDPCCCVSMPPPAATAPAAISLDAPTSVHVPAAVVPMVAAAVHAQAGFGRLAPDARSGSPPGLPVGAQSPRGPPYSA